MQMIEEDKRRGLPEISLWSLSGSVLLLGAFAVLLFKYAPFYWPLTVIACAGYGAIRLWKKGGLALSFAALVIAAILMERSGEELFWITLLPTSIAISWMLIFLRDREMEVLALERHEKFLSLEKNGSGLQEQLRITKAALIQKNQESLTEKERLNALYVESASALKMTKICVEVLEKEKESLKDKCEHLSQVGQTLSEKCDSLTQEVLAYQQKEIDSQQALNCAQNELFTLKNTLCTLQARQDISQENVQDSGSSEEAHSGAKMMQYKYATLREQFEEKSAILDDTRKELFKVENELLALQKACQEKDFESSDEELMLIKELSIMDEERRGLEDLVRELQEFISSLLAPKKRASVSRKINPKNLEALPDMIQDKIDQTIST